MKHKTKVQFPALMVTSLMLLAVGGCILKPLPHSDYRPIHQAAAGCDAANVTLILHTNPAALNLTEDGGRSPLHVASARCCTNVIALLLLKEGVKVELRGKTGETALHLAAQEGCVDAVGLLVAHGAKLNPRDEHGHTPLKRAMDYEQDATAALLRKLGAVE